MAKKTDLMEEDEFLSEETMDGDCVVLQDETGRLLTEEEAAVEEERLLMKIDNFFLANPAFPQMEAEEEEEDEEDTLVTLNKEGEIIKEVTTILSQKDPVGIETGKLTITNDNTPSLFEEQLTIRVIRKHLSKISQVSMKIEEVESALYELCEGGSLHDNIIDAIRKERNELTSLLSVKPVKLSNLRNKQLRGRLEAESRELMDKIVDLTFSFED